jgi:hypothetical protein
VRGQSQPLARLRERRHQRVDFKHAAARQFLGRLRPRQTRFDRAHAPAVAGRQLPVDQEDRDQESRSQRQRQAYLCPPERHKGRTQVRQEGIHRLRTEPLVDADPIGAVDDCAFVGTAVRLRPNGIIQGAARGRLAIHLAVRIGRYPADQIAVLAPQAERGVCRQADAAHTCCCRSSNMPVRMT